MPVGGFTPAAACSTASFKVGAALAVLATYRHDGTVLLSPVWHEWRDGGFHLVTGSRDMKAAHLRRDVRAGIVVCEDWPPNGSGLWAALAVRPAGVAGLRDPAWSCRSPVLHTSNRSARRNYSSTERRISYLR
jgi:hypothetical protein